MGFGQAYSDEICALSGVEPSKPCGRLKEEEVARMFSVIRQLGEAEAQPVTYGDGSIFPLPLASRKDPPASRGRASPRPWTRPSQGMWQRTPQRKGKPSP